MSEEYGNQTGESIAKEREVSLPEIETPKWKLGEDDLGEWLWRHRGNIIILNDVVSEIFGYLPSDGRSGELADILHVLRYTFGQQSEVLERIIDPPTSVQ
jgi:hypothetical protein